MRWIPLAVLALAFSTADAAPVPKHLMKDEPFWPTTVGAKWVYTVGETERVEEIIKAEARQDAMRLTIRGSLGDSTIDVTRAGVTLRTFDKAVLNYPLIQFPLRAGDSWVNACPVRGGVVKGHAPEGGCRTVGEEEDIKVPAGTFRATKVVYVVTEVNGRPLAKPSTGASWYAKGVGVVRVE